MIPGFFIAKILWRGTIKEIPHPKSLRYGKKIKKRSQTFWGFFDTKQLTTHATGPLTDEERYKFHIAFLKKRPRVPKKIKK